MIFIMRHGLTDWNSLMKLQGQTDIPLNGEGIRMAGEAAELYRDILFDICYCSPLIRAKQTAEIVLKGRNVPIVCDDRLKEMSFGVCEGITDYRNPRRGPIGILFQSPGDYEVVEGGESLDELFKRTKSFLEDMVYPLHKEGRSILIVGHGAMNSSIVCQVKNYSREDFWKDGIENCRLMKLL